MFSYVFGEFKYNTERLKNYTSHTHNDISPYVNKSDVVTQFLVMERERVEMGPSLTQSNQKQSSVTIFYFLHIFFGQKTDLSNCIP